MNNLKSKLGTIIVVAIILIAISRISKNDKKQISVDKIYGGKSPSSKENTTVYLEKEEVTGFISKRAYIYANYTFFNYGNKSVSLNIYFRYFDRMELFLEGKPLEYEKEDIKTIVINLTIQEKIKKTVFMKYDLDIVGLKDVNQEKIYYEFVYYLSLYGKLRIRNGHQMINSSIEFKIDRNKFDGFIWEDSAKWRWNITYDDDSIIIKRSIESEFVSDWDYYNGINWYGNYDRTLKEDFFENFSPISVFLIVVLIIIFTFQYLLEKKKSKRNKI